jgi:FkbM family methyltransferase
MEGSTKRIVQTGQGLFHLDLVDRFVSRSLLNGSYGRGEIELARTFLDADSRVLVVGAHIGAIAIPLSKHCRQLVAIEANPDTCASLKINVRLNQCSNVTVHEVAANDRREALPFVMNTHNSGGSKRMPKLRHPAYFYDDPRVIEVAGVRLDDFLDPPDFDLVFMDIEGSEYFAFLGMQRILARAAALIVEFLPHHLTRVAGVSVDEFLRPLIPHFDLLTVPSIGVDCLKETFLPTLNALFDAGRGDAGIVFRKKSEDLCD